MRFDLNLNTVTLWAMWYTKYGPTTMQGWKGCDQLQTDQTITLTDARDNNQYTVAKFSDGKCWMNQNLRLTGPITLTSSDSDVSNNFELPTSTAPSTFSDSANSLRVHYDSSQSSAYYNWFTVTVESGSNINSEQIAPYSICPKGWSLPTKEEADKIRQLGVPTLRSSPYNFAATGGCDGNPLNRQGEMGCWFTSQKSSTGSGYSLHLFFSGRWVNQTGITAYQPGQGHTARCIKK